MLNSLLIFKHKVVLDAVHNFPLCLRRLKIFVTHSNKLESIMKIWQPCVTIDFSLHIKRLLLLVVIVVVVVNIIKFPDIREVESPYFFLT